MNLYEAIYVRRSVRKFRMEPLDDKTMQGIAAFIKDMEPLFPEIKTSIGMIDNLAGKSKFQGVANVSAPYYLAVYTEEKEKCEMNAGYIMQQLSLYLTARGIGSCYQGMARKRDRKMEDEGLSCVLVLAFGYPKSSAVRQDYEARRLSLEELCAYKERPKSHIKELLETARLAPSSFNSQPWRFVVYENRFHIFSKKPVGGRHLFNKHNEINFGIMLANIMVAAEEIWVDVDLIKLNNITHKSLPNNQYVISVLMRP